MTRSTGQHTTATKLLDGRVLVVGGTRCLDCAEVFDPAANAFTATSSLHFGRSAHTATLLADGKVLIVGSTDRVWETFQSAELYDPQAGTFTLLSATLSDARFGHVAVLLLDGRVLVAGGSVISSPGYATNLDSAEIFDSTAGSFSLLPARMTTPRYFQSSENAVVLDDGDVFLLGGGFEGELFDPATGAFRPTSPFNVPRDAASVTKLAIGRVLVTGGYVTMSGLSATTDSVEIFDPSTETFTLATPMMEARQQHTATLLSSLKVLVAGGADVATGSDFKSAELFQPRRSCR